MPLIVSMLKTTVFQSMAISLGRDAQHGDLAAVAMLSIMSRKAGGVAGHFQPDVESLLHAELLLGLGERSVRDIDGERRAHLAASSSR